METTILLNIDKVQKYRPINLIKQLRSNNWCVSSKAALITLMWSFYIGIAYGLVSNPSGVLLETQWILSVIYIGDAISLCFYPLAGYLADNVLGRYKIIIASLIIFIFAFIVALIPVAVSIVLFTNPEWGCDPTLFASGQQNVGCDVGFIGLIVVPGLFYIAINISFIGFNANIIQFGMDQLHDSPAEHQSLFIYWYVWIYYIIQLIILQPWNMLYIEFITSYTLFAILGVCPFIMVIVLVCIAHRNKNWFLIIPARINPYKLVYKVTHFARQHKVPVQRSAFTYCEDEIPTGLDLAKTKYGGPYTTEDVENVKAFYGILKILLSLSPVFILLIAADHSVFWYNIQSILPIFYGHYLSYQIIDYFFDDNTLSAATVVLLIPLYLLIFRKCMRYYSVSMLKRIGLGIIFLIMTLIMINASILYTSASKKECFFPSLNYRYKYHNYSEFYYSDPTINDVSIPAMLIIFSRCLYGISNMLLYTGLYEFVCAQSPPSMKGLLIGLSFAIKGIFQAIGSLILIPFGYFPPSFPNCGLWYYGINTLLSFFSLIVFIYYAKKYKYRQRDEICNIYQYAEDYYSKTEE